MIDKDDPVKVEQAKKMITDMIKRGYILAVEVDGKLQPVRKFDPQNFEYVIVESSTESEIEKKPQKKRGAYKSIPAGEAKLTAIPRTAGG